MVTMDAVPSRISLQVNIDGTPIPFAAPKTSFWPVLVRLHGHQLSPFVVTLFCTKGKPKALDEALMDFKEELQKVLANGITIGTTLVEVDLHCFVCDAPARSEIKKTKSHVGHYSCERCTIRGARESSVEVFVKDGSEVERTDERFEALEYIGLDESRTPRHQVGQSIFVGVIPCVSKFVLDSMHLIFLGVVKRLVSFWKGGSGIQLPCQLSQEQIARVSEQLVSLQGCLPSELTITLNIRPMESYGMSDVSTVHCSVHNEASPY